jgi:hypothetical protein
MDKKDIDRLHFLGGQVQSLMSFAFAVIETHPDPAALLQAFELHFASTKVTKSPEQYFEGMADARARLLHAFSIP